MNDITFSSINELYKHLLPALKTRKKEIELSGFNYVMNEDIFNFLKEKKWNKAKDLCIYDMVSDILNCDPYDIDKYLKNEMKKLKRELTEDDALL